MSKAFSVCAALAFGACAAAPALAATASSFSSFEGEEEPRVIYDVQSGHRSDGFDNMTMPASGTFRFFLRYRRGDWWDGDMGTDRTDRQRAEVKGLGPRQRMNETYEYGTTWRSDSDFRGTSRFTHIFQLKATNGTLGPPMITLSINDGTSSAGLKYCSGPCSSGHTTARGFTWSRATWQTNVMRVRTSTSSGEVRLSRNGDAFTGRTGIPVFLNGSTEYRPKWGLYRGVNRDSPLNDDSIEHRNVTANRR